MSNTDISKLRINDDYNIKDAYARSNMLNKNAGSSQICIPAVSFKGGVAINDSSIKQDTSDNTKIIVDNKEWNFLSGLKSGGSPVLTKNDLTSDNFVGKNQGVGKGEIFGDYTNNKANGTNSFVAGRNNISNSANQAIFGQYNNINTNDIFEIGCGDSDTVRRNALSLTRDGILTVNNVVTSSINLNELAETCTWTKTTNNTSIQIDDTDYAVVLSKSFDATTTPKPAFITIPLTLDKDGDIEVKINDDIYKKYCQKGKDIINIIYQVGAGVSNIEIKLKSSYSFSDFRILKAKIETIENYLNTLTYTPVDVDTTSPIAVVAQNEASLLI